MNSPCDDIDGRATIPLDNFSIWEVGVVCALTARDEVIRQESANNLYLFIIEMDGVVSVTVL